MNDSVRVIPSGGRLDQTESVKGKRTYNLTRLKIKNEMPNFWVFYYKTKQQQQRKQTRKQMKLICAACPWSIHEARNKYARNVFY